ncbi:MAG: hypothetical protein ACKOSR_15090, partial [Flavobacteriales bacterium]
LFVCIWCCVASQATAQYTSSIELISKEIAAQASARQVSKLVILDITEGSVVSEYAHSLSEELRIHMAINNASMVIIDRSVTEKIMEEQRLASSPLFDQSSAVCNRTYMSPLDMFHHPEMMQWSSMQADLADDGVGEITQKSSSEKWYYWLSSIIQVRYQL